MLLGPITAARKDNGGRDHHCDVINNVIFSLYLMLMTSNVRQVYILHGCWPIRSESQHRAWDKVYIYIYISMAYWIASFKDCWALFQYKDHTYRFRYSHYRYKIVLRWFYPYTGTPFTAKVESLYWDNPLMSLLLTWLDLNPSMDK